MYARREAVLSSQIEGTQASLVEVLEYEAAAARKGLRGDVAEVVNYVRAMNYGLERLESLPVSLRLIREIHEILLANVRGGRRSPGEFRRTQNWIGPLGCTLAQAAFVPPPPHEMMAALGDLETFLHADVDLPALVNVGLVHAQFETIHPFIDGNGRVGRLLITFLLCQRKILRRPLLYLSLYVTRHKLEYYERLMAIRDYGDWEGWLRFFLRGVAEVANQATDTARRILELREAHRHLVSERIRGSANGLRLLDLLYEQPIVSARLVARDLAVSNPTANSLVNRFEKAGLLTEMTGRQRNRLFRYESYLSLFEDDLPHPSEEPAEGKRPVTASD
jgi:Fic family protein